MQELNSSHFVRCNGQFIKLVMTHSVYTFSSGNIRIEWNDLGIIEKSFVQQFVSGKPTISHTLGIPQVIWEQPKHDTQIILAVKKNIAQVCYINSYTVEFVAC